MARQLAGWILLGAVACITSYAYGGAALDPATLNEIRTDGRKLADEGKFREAEKLFRYVMFSGFATARDRVDLGMTLVAVGNREDGLAMLNSVIDSIDRSQAASLSFRAGRVFEQQGRLADAKHFLGRAVTLCPESAQFQASLAQVLFRLHEFGASQRHYEIGRRLDPTIVKHEPPYVFDFK